MKGFPYLGRVQNSMTTMKDSTFESKAYGKRVNKVISIEGRIQFDLLQVCLYYNMGLGKGTLIMGNV